MVAMKDIQELGLRIAREFEPKRIVLFGSYAAGAPGPDSDVDLLVILPHTGKAVEKSVEIRLKVRPHFPLDILVRTPEKVRERLAMGDSFMQDIPENGDLAVIEFNDGNHTFKRIYVQGAKWILAPINPAHEPEFRDQKEIRQAMKVWGVRF